MALPIKILSTDFDGTLHTDMEDPPVPQGLQDLIASMQTRGVSWVINTGRDLPSLTDTLEKVQLSIRPDFVVTVEREIHARDGDGFAGLTDWNEPCRLAHDQVFRRLRADMPQLVAWVRSRFDVTIYEDAFSPFCLIARNDLDADRMQAFFEGYCRSVPNLSYVRNTVYARFSHVDYNKGSALAEIGRRLGVSPEQIVAAGDHLNDLPMLSSRYARWLIAPGNAIDAVKEAVRRQDGYISDLPSGSGLMRGLEHVLGAISLRNGGLNPLA